MGDGAQVALELLGGHADTVIRNHDGTGVLIKGNTDGQVTLVELDARILQALKVELVDGIARSSFAGFDNLACQTATAHGGQHGDAAHNIGLPRCDAFVQVARRRNRSLCICRALQFLGKRARAAGELAVHVQRHVDASLRLIDSVEFALVALLVHKNGAAHQRRVIKATRLKLNIHSHPFIRHER